MDAGSKSQTNSAAKTSRSQSPEPADGRDPCSAPFPHSPAPLCHADPPSRSPSAPWQVKCPERTPDLCSGCQLYFCLPSLPRENQPLSSSVAQPARSGAEARICMAEWIRQRLFLPAHRITLCTVQSTHRRPPRAFNQLSTSGYFLCKTLQNTEEPKGAGAGAAAASGEKIRAVNKQR